MYFSVKNMAKVLIDSVGLSLSVTDIEMYARFGHDRAPYRPVLWTQASLCGNLEEELKDRPEAQLRHDLRVALEHVPDDATCALIGWFVQGYLLSEAINGGMLANNNPEVQINLLCALEPEKLSLPVLDMLDDDIERFKIAAGVPARLLGAISSFLMQRDVEDEDNDDDDDPEDLDELEPPSSERH